MVLRIGSNIKELVFEDKNQNLGSTKDRNESRFLAINP